MKRTIICLLLLAAGVSAHAALPGDAALGKKLHDANCVKCHDSGVYSRPDHQMQSLEQLNERLGACAHAAEVVLTDEEQASIVKYLNEQYYHFE